MRREILFLISLLILAIPGPLRAQAGAAGDSVFSVRNGPIRTLLEHRAQMGLTEEQVTRLRAIQESVESRNRPLVQRFLEIRQRWERERPANFRVLPLARRRQIEQRFQNGIREESRGLGEQIQTNNRQAMLEVRALLTNPQRQRLRRFLEQAPANAAGPTGAGAATSPPAPDR